MRATAVVAAALTAAAALTLTACGGGGGSGDTIDGGSPHSPAPTATSAPATTAPPTSPPMTADPHLTLPADLHLVFDWPAPSAHTEAAVLGNAANYLRAIAHGIAHRNAGDPLVGQYARAGGGAATYARAQIQQAVKGGWTLTGTDRYYRPTVRLGSSGNGATVGFCDFDGKEYGKDVRTGRRVGGSAVDDSSYVYFTIVMARFPAGVDLWQAVSVNAKEKATQCKE
jgi:hypothetical protein